MNKDKLTEGRDSAIKGAGEDEGLKPGAETGNLPSGRDSWAKSLEGTKADTEGGWAQKKRQEPKNQQLKTTPHQTRETEASLLGNVQRPFRKLCCWSLLASRTLKSLYAQLNGFKGASFFLRMVHCWVDFYLAITSYPNQQSGWECHHCSEPLVQSSAVTLCRISQPYNVNVEARSIPGTTHTLLLFCDRLAYKNDQM